jgi:hypothetical protein
MENAMSEKRPTRSRKKQAKQDAGTAAAIPEGEALLPSWVRSHFETSLDAHEKLMQIGRLAAQGIGMHTGRPRLVKALAKAYGKDAETDADTLEKLEQAQKDADLAQLEIEQDFPVLNGLVAIGIWSWLEDFVKGLLENWFLHRRSSMGVPAVHRLKVRLGDYLQLTKTEQARLLVELLEQDLAGPLKQGLGRFNCLLEVVGLNVSLNEQEAKALFEFQRVRNNLAHRNGRVDARLKAECPWLKQKVGSELRISQRMLFSYSNASAAFLLRLLYQVGDKFGVNLRPDDEQEGRAVPAKEAG